MDFAAVARLALLLASLALAASPASAQQRRPAMKRVTLSALTAQGFEVKAFAPGQALIVQKGAQVYRCNLRVADTSPLSYQSDCYAIH
jgi:ribosomal protein S12